MYNFYQRSPNSTCPELAKLHQYPFETFPDKMHYLLYTLICIYAFIKLLFGYTANNNFQQSDKATRFCLRTIFITLTLITCLLIACSLLPFVVWYNMVDVYLRIKLGSLYGGVLKRLDSTIQATKGSLVVRVVFILNENTDARDIWVSCLENARTIHLSSYKLSSTLRYCLGYYYYHKDQIKFEDVVEEIRICDGEYVTRDAFIDYVTNLPHPQAEKRLWSLSYFPQRILWNNKSKTKNQHAIIVSFQHCLTDGPNGMKYLVKHFMNDSYKPPQSNILINLKDMPKFSIDDAYIVQNPFHQTHHYGLPKLNMDVDESYLAIFAEDTERYLSLIKKVKTKIGVGFTSIVMGVFCTSLADYFRMKQHPSGGLIFGTVVRPEEINLVFKSRVGDPLINDIGMQIIKIPATQAALSIRKNIQEINNSIKQVRRSLDTTMLYAMANWATFLPSIVLTRIIERLTDGTSAIITNMSGLENLDVAGHGIESAFFDVSYKQDVAFALCFMSLDGRLQISLRCDGKYVSNREELQKILDRTLGYIDELAKELQIA